MGQWHVQIEKREIDYVTVEETVCQVSQYPGKEQRQRNIAQPIMGTTPPHKQRENEDEREAGENNEKCVVVFEGAEGRPVVCHVHDREEIRHDDMNVLGPDKSYDQALGDLIQEIERQGEQQNVFHGNVTSVDSLHCESLNR